MEIDYDIVKVMNMSAFIKNYRKDARLTQAQLAEKMNVSVVSVQNWEKGKTEVSIKKYMDLAEIFNVPIDKLIEEKIKVENEKRPDEWPDFLFSADIKAIIDTLHLNLAQQDLFGLLYIYGAEYLEKREMDRDTFDEDLKRIPYGYIDRVGSIQFMNQAEGLHKVINYIKTDFLMKVLRQNPEAEFNVRKLSKDFICEFIDSGHKSEACECEKKLYLPICMQKARIMLPILEKNAPVHITDGWWSNPIRDDIPEKVLEGILEMCNFQRDLLEEGYYKDKYTTSYIRSGLESVTDYKSISVKGEEDWWVWEINDKGRKLLEWFKINTEKPTK